MVCRVVWTVSPVSTRKVKVKVWTLAYSVTYMSQTRDQQRFTISEVASDWHEPMVPQRIMWPSIARANGHLDPRCSQQTHHRPNQPHQAFTPQPQLLLISRPAEGRRLSWPEHTVGQQLAQGCLRWTGCESNPQPLGYESDTLPLDHCTQCVQFLSLV